MVNIDFPAETVFAAIALFCTIAVPITLIAGRLDPRRLGGDGVWSKPFKFALSLTVHFATFAVITHLLPHLTQEGIGLRIVSWIASAAGLFEIGYISIQAARGRHSHFNASTPTEAVMAALMGVGAVLVLVPAAYIGFLMVTPSLAAWALPVRIGVAIGFLGSAVLTLMTGLAMGAARSHFTVSHAVGSSSMRMRLTGWSLTTADLRPSHFLTAHMMQLVPVTALMASVLLPDPAALTVTIMIGSGWGFLTWHAYRSALAGRALPNLFRAIAQAE